MNAFRSAAFFYTRRVNKLKAAFRPFSGRGRPVETFHE